MAAGGAGVQRAGHRLLRGGPPRAGARRRDFITRAGTRRRDFKTRAGAKRCDFNTHVFPTCFVTFRIIIVQCCT